MKMTLERIAKELTYDPQLHKSGTGRYTLSFESDEGWLTLKTTQPGLYTVGAEYTVDLRLVR